MKKIIINFPSNIGDTIISLPVLDRIKGNYPQAKITAIASPKTKDFMEHNSSIDKVILFDKLWSIKQKINFAFAIRNKFEIFVDLKHTLLPFISRAKMKTPLFYRNSPKNCHAKNSYLELIKKIAPLKNEIKSVFILNSNEKKIWDTYNFKPSIFICLSSRAKLKQYPYQRAKILVESLKTQYPIIIVGEERDRWFYQDILSFQGVTDLTGKTKITDIFYLFKNYARAVICADSSLLHIGSYLNLPLAAIFGPTDTKRYGPWADNYVVLKNNLQKCVPCGKPRCRLIPRENYQMKLPPKCMDIPPKEIISAIKQFFLTP